MSAGYLMWTVNNVVTFERVVLVNQVASPASKTASI